MVRLFAAIAPLALASRIAAAPALAGGRTDGDCTPVVTTVTVYTTGVSSAETYQPQESDPAWSSHGPSATRTHHSSQQPTETPTSHDAGGGGAGTFKNALYFTNWGIYGADFQPQQIPGGEVTHLLYAFADIAPDGEVKSSDTYADVEKHYSTDSWNDAGNNAYGCVKQIFLQKKRNRKLKVLLSIGGWTYSPKFPAVAATAAGRQRFASSAVRILADWGLDGLDVDWEYPRNPEEAHNFVLLLQACREALDDYAARHAAGHHFLLTIASPAGSQNYNTMDMQAMDPLLDGWHLMAYDYAGSWDSTSGHQANLFANPSNSESTKFDTASAVEAYLARGVAAHKISLGIPLYGRSFLRTDGVGMPYNGLGEGSIETGVWLYRDLPRPGATEMFDDVSKAAYSYDAVTKELVSYDTVESAAVKTEYLVSRGLGGAVFWEASGDRTDERSLVGAVARGMPSLDPVDNWLDYPDSQYDNIRAGMPGA